MDMTLYLIGLGLNDEKDITLRGLEAAKKCDRIYLEYYTSILNCSKEELEKLIGKEIIMADRELVEQKPESTILKDSNDGDAALLVIGDPLGATTHTDLMIRAKNMGIDVEVIHNASIMNAVSITGLELYKFGKTTSIPFPEKGFTPKTPYEVLRLNMTLEYHTLMLLDLRPGEKRFMSVNDAIKYLLEVESKEKEGIFTEETMCVGCARIGCKDQKIMYGTAKELLEVDFGKALHCLIVPGKLHFIEEEALEEWK